MTDYWLVTRFCPSVLSSIAGIGLPREALMKTVYNPPVITDGTRLFLSREDAEAYAEQANEELKNPKADANGTYCIDASPYTDYGIVPLHIEDVFAREDCGMGAQVTQGKAYLLNEDDKDE